LLNPWTWPGNQASCATHQQLLAGCTSNSHDHMLISYKPSLLMRQCSQLLILWHTTTPLCSPASSTHQQCSSKELLLLNRTDHDGTCDKVQTATAVSCIHRRQLWRAHMPAQQRTRRYRARSSVSTCSGATMHTTPAAAIIITAAAA
jgi:hypothetical protein